MVRNSLKMNLIPYWNLLYNKQKTDKPIYLSMILISGLAQTTKGLPTIGTERADDATTPITGNTSLQNTYLYSLNMEIIV